ncbi:fibronectin type III domain-containing protein [bacterium]|nr:fibronectin type III domain-containing protein [bacterium]
MIQARQTLALVGILFLLAASGCSNGSSSGVAVQTVQPDHSWQLPDVFSSDPVREPSVLYTESVAGIQCEIINGGTEKDGYKLALDGGGAPAWGIGRFNGLSSEPTDYIQARINVSDVFFNETYYRLMANFSTGRWDVKPVSFETPTAAIDILADFDPAQHISTNGNTYIGLLTSSATVTLDIIFFDYNVDLQPPANLQAVGSESGDSILLSWELPELWDGYRLYAKQSSDTDDDYVLILESAEELPGYTHTITDLVLPCLYGVDYDYRMTALLGGLESDPGEVATASRLLPAPTLRVSQGLYRGFIPCVWHMPEGTGALDYDIYRDGVLRQADMNFIPPDGGYFADFDPAANDGEFHAYHVVAKGPEGNSPPSEVVDGYAAIVDVHRFVSFDNLHDPHADVFYTAGFSSQPVFGYYNETGNKLVYHKYDHDNFSFGVNVTDAEVTTDISCLSDFNRPWIAYNNHNSSIKAEGLWIARGQDDNPSGSEWDNYLLYPGDIVGRRVSMAFINGQLAVVFAVRVDVGQYDVKFAYALNADPQSEMDWKVKDMLPPGLGSFPDVMMLRELDGLPLVVMARQDILRVLRGKNGAPTDQAAWDNNNVDNTLDGDRDLDFVINDGILSISVGGCQVEGTGDLRYYRCTGTDPISEPWEQWQIRTYDDENAEMADLYFREGFPIISVPHGVWASANTFVLEYVDDPLLDGVQWAYYYDNFDNTVDVRYFSRMFGDSGVFRTAYLRSWDDAGDKKWGIYVATNTPK